MNVNNLFANDPALATAMQAQAQLQAATAAAPFFNMYAPPVLDPMAAYMQQVMLLQGQAAVQMQHGVQMHQAALALAAQAVTAQQASVQGLANATAAPSDKRCAHNDWTPVGPASSFQALKCAVCSATWDVSHRDVPRCRVFWEAGECPHGSACDLPHISHGRVATPPLDAATDTAAAAAGRQSSRDGRTVAPPPDDVELAAGVAVHVLPDGDADDGSFLATGGVGRTVAECGDGAWSVEESGWEGQRGRVHEVPADRLRVAWKQGSDLTDEQLLDAQFTVAPPSGETVEAADIVAGVATAGTIGDLQLLVTDRLSCSAFLQAMSLRPCNHNNWDNVRMLKGRIGLRCRACHAHWKADIAIVIKCPAFFKGYCPHGALCPLPHIHRYKNREKEQEKAMDKALTEQSYSVQFYAAGKQGRERCVAAEILTDESIGKVLGRPNSGHTMNAVRDCLETTCGADEEVMPPTLLADFP
eukprot:Rhum_TRINITY_DN14511_c6_g1::Rhum_TRINITY_DN14511_c6_g1_i1::g.93750::m.93750